MYSSFDPFLTDIIKYTYTFQLNTLTFFFSGVHGLKKTIFSQIESCFNGI